MRGNPDYWTGQEVTGYERKQRLLVPRKDEMLDTIVDLMPFDPQAAITVLDVGAGQGSLSARVLERFPQARVVLFDASSEMLSVAEQHLAPYAPRFELVQGSFDDPGWCAFLAQPVDAIVSSIALHYLDTARRPAFFREVNDLLSPGGFFAHGGAFDSEHPVVQAYWDQMRLEHTQRMLYELEGREVSLETLREKGKRETTKAGVHRLRLNEQRRLLEQAGFGHVETAWRTLFCAVVVAYKG